MQERMSRRTLLGGGLALAGGLLAEQTVTAVPKKKRRVLVWSEGTAPKSVYPNDINTAIAEGLKPLKDWEIVTASINDPEQGVSEKSLAETDVLIWWGHQRHGDVTTDNVERIVKHVKERGMGFLPTHSAHYARPLQKILGTPCGWKGGYIEDGSKLTVLVTAPKHPITKGIKDFIVPHTERYGDPFEVPTPETLLFNGLYNLPNGTTQNAQQGMVWTVGKGRVFYFQPGHESYPIYFQPEIRQIFINGVQWLAPKK